MTIAIRQVRYLHYMEEQDHRAVRRLTRPMLGFKSSLHLAISGTICACRVAAKTCVTMCDDGAFPRGEWEALSSRSEETPHENDPPALRPGHGRPRVWL
jgi:hypothetical protein